MGEIESGYHVGPLHLRTDNLKAALVNEAKAWSLAYGRHVNETCSRDMDALVEFFDDMQKRLSRPIKDLDDIRAHMAALGEIRADEVRIDLTIAPIEDAYAMFCRYGLAFNDGNAERVDSLGYGWRLLRQQVSSAANRCCRSLSRAFYSLNCLTMKHRDSRSFVITKSSFVSISIVSRQLFIVFSCDFCLGSTFKC